MNRRIGSSRVCGSWIGSRFRSTNLPWRTGKRRPFSSLFFGNRRSINRSDGRRHIERLTHVAFTTELDKEPFDLIVNFTRLFLYRNAIRKLMEASASPPEIISQAGAESWENNFRAMESLPGSWEYITNGDQIDELEKRFLRGSGKSQDGFVSRYLNRPISRVVTRLLLRFPTTPNAWTLWIFPLPVIASLILSRGTYGSFVWALILFQIFSILDGCDGEIARAKFMESERGRKLDALCDVLSNILCSSSGLGFGLRTGAS